MGSPCAQGWLSLAPAEPGTPPCVKMLRLVPAGRDSSQAVLFPTSWHRAQRRRVVENNYLQLSHQLTRNASQSDKLPTWSELSRGLFRAPKPPEHPTESKLTSIDFVSPKLPTRELSLVAKRTTRRDRQCGVDTSPTFVSSPNFSTTPPLHDYGTEKPFHTSPPSFPCFPSLSFF